MKTIVIAALSGVLLASGARAGADTPAVAPTLVCQIDRSNDEDPDGCMGVFLRCKAPGDKEARLLSFINPLIAQGWVVERQHGDLIYLHHNGPLTEMPQSSPAHPHE